VNSVSLPALDLARISDLYAVPSQPWLRINMVASLDGVIAVDDDSKALSCPEDRAIYRALREMADAVVVGARTGSHPGYAGLTRPLVVVSNSGTISSDAPQLIAVVPSASVARVRADHPRALVISAGENEVDLTAAISQLHAHGLPNLLCEGGPSLLGSLLQTGLVDELCLTLSPLLVGTGPRLVELGATVRLSLSQVLAANNFLFTRYGVDSHPDQSVGE
jgi:riboflavin biosynthesis pyrimidine reductase